MSWFDRLLGREERTRSTIVSSDPYLAEWFGVGTGAVGHVDVHRAGGLATALACRSLIATQLASIPLNLYRRTTNGGREKAGEHPLHAVLHDMAAPGMTAFEAREMMIDSLLVTGNAYARIEANGRGEVVGLAVLDPRTVAVERLASGRLRYRVTGSGGGVQVLLQEEMLHLRNRLDANRALGVSPVQLAREMFAVALAQQDATYSQSKHGFRPEGVVTFPTLVGAGNKTDMLAKLEAKIKSQSETSRVLVLDGGVEWKPMAFSSKDAEFLESRKLTNLDICRIFNVPPTSVGILDHGTYSNVEQESRALVTRCLSPLAKRIEQAMNMALVPEWQRRELFIEHDLAGLLRGDLGARYDAYKTGREWGWLSVNEIRGWENLPAVEGGDERLSPLNMTPLGTRAEGALP